MTSKIDVDELFHFSFSFQGRRQFKRFAKNLSPGQRNSGKTLVTVRGKRFDGRRQKIRGTHLPHEIERPPSTTSQWSRLLFKQLRFLFAYIFCCKFNFLFVLLVKYIFFFKFRVMDASTTIHCNWLIFDCADDLKFASGLIVLVTRWH